MSLVDAVLFLLNPPSRQVLYVHQLLSKVTSLLQNTKYLKKMPHCRSLHTLPHTPVCSFMPKPDKLHPARLVSMWRLQMPREHKTPKRRYIESILKVASGRWTPQHQKIPTLLFSKCNPFPKTCNEIHEACFRYLT